MRKTFGASGTGYSGVGTTRSKWRGEIRGKPRCTECIRPLERRRSSRTTGTLRRPVAMARSGGSPLSCARVEASTLANVLPSSAGGTRRSALYRSIFSSNGSPSAWASASTWLLSPRWGPSSAQTRGCGLLGIVAPVPRSQIGCRSCNRSVTARTRSREARSFFLCGIAGWYRRGGRPVPQQAIVGQCDRLISRGPDDAGYFVDADFGFGMRRLSIVDIAGGHQPIFSPDGRYAIVFNGEIVNHPALRRELEGGYEFHTDHSDTETILAAYLSWGDDAWLRLQGMYAVAIWDKHAKSLTLARDPVGIKPLFFTNQARGIAVASEISALRELPDHRFDLDQDGVDDFFCFGHTLPPRTIFKQVRPLEPGHVLHIGAMGEPVIRRFWQARLKVEEGLSEADWIERTRAELLRTVEEHQLSDVPVGAFVSGGVDSGAIAAAMARTSSQPFKMFTAGFPGSPRDETAAAKRIADHLGCEHIVLPMQPQTAADVLPAVQASFDEPTAANSAIPLWYLSRAAAEHVKVVLCGEGGDELFLGYNRQRWARRMARWRALAGPAGVLERMPQLPIRQWNYVGQLAGRFREGASLRDGYERFFAAVSISTPDLRSRIFDPAFFERQRHRDGIAQRAVAYFPPDES